MSQLPYLSGALREDFDRWSEATLARHLPPLTFTELRKGVAALEPLFATRPPRRAGISKETEGAGKRAALATFYAQLSFLAVHHALLMLEPERFRAAQLVDLGAGTGAAGVAAARTIEGVRRVSALDRSGWALDEAQRTAESFGVTLRRERAELPEGLPRVGRGALIVMAHAAFELDDEARALLLRRLIAARRKGAALFVLERLTRPEPWWRAWADALAPEGVSDEVLRVAIERPPLVREVDRAARLDNQVLGMRVLAGPLEEAP